MRKLSLISLVSLAAVAACVDDPQDPKMWIKKLGDVRESKEAVRQLVKLKDPVAVAPLIEFYKKGKDPDVLKAVASFKDASSVPVLIDSLDFSEESYDGASIAASALGEIGDKSAVEPLIKAVQKTLPVKSRANVVRVEALKALAKMKDPRSTDALMKVMSTSADDQDFYLNKLAARALAEIADPKSAGVLVRGLFMTGRGADIYQPCRTALIAIGDPAIDKLIDAMQRKNTDIEADAKKYEFFPGIVVQKTSTVLGDMRAKKAVAALTEQLGKPDGGLEASKQGKGVSEHQSVIIALGQIGDPTSVKTLTNVLNDAKRSFKHRAAAAEALNLIGDVSALPALSAVATKTKWLNGTTIDPEAASVAAAGITNYSRLAEPGSPALALPKLDAELTDSDMGVAQKVATDRQAVANECKKDVACYGKYLADGQDANKGEKAAFMLARLGKPALPVLQKALSGREPLVRMALLFALSRVADKSDEELLKTLDAQIALDESKPPMRGIVDEMVALRALLRRG